VDTEFDLDLNFNLLIRKKIRKFIIIFLKKIIDLNKNFNFLISISLFK